MVGGLTANSVTCCIGVGLLLLYSFRMALIDTEPQGRWHVGASLLLPWSDEFHCLETVEWYRAGLRRDRVVPVRDSDLT